MRNTTCKARFFNFCLLHLSESVVTIFCTIYPRWPRKVNLQILLQPTSGKNSDSILNNVKQSIRKNVKSGMVYT